MKKRSVRTLLALALVLFSFRSGAAGLQAVILAALAYILAQEGI